MTNINEQIQELKEVAARYKDRDVGVAWLEVAIALLEESQGGCAVMAHPNQQLAEEEIRRKMSIESIEKEIHKKNPLGLRPRFLVEEERMEEIFEAIDRAVDAGEHIRYEWVTELRDLMSSRKCR